MPVDPKHAEEYELPEITEGGSYDPFDREDQVERDVLLRRSGSQDKLEGDERDDRPLLGSGSEAFEESELVGKGTKIDDLIARVCISCIASTLQVFDAENSR